MICPLPAVASPSLRTLTPRYRSQIDRPGRGKPPVPWLLLRTVSCQNLPVPRSASCALDCLAPYHLLITSLDCWPARGKRVSLESDSSGIPCVLVTRGFLPCGCCSCVSTGRSIPETRVAPLVQERSRLAEHSASSQAPSWAAQPPIWWRS